MISMHWLHWLATVTVVFKLLVSFILFPLPSMRYTTLFYSLAIEFRLLFNSCKYPQFVNFVEPSASDIWRPASSTNYSIDGWRISEHSFRQFPLHTMLIGLSLTQFRVFLTIMTHHWRKIKSIMTDYHSKFILLIRQLTFCMSNSN